MQIEMKVNVDKILKQIELSAMDKIDAIMIALNDACLRTVTRARTQHGYTTQSGYLQASVGYSIALDGQIVSKNFDVSENREKSVAGAIKGEEVANNVLQNYPTGLVAVIVAGAEYAVYVEGRGFDVITGAMNNFASEFRNAINEVKNA